MRRGDGDAEQLPLDRARDLRLGEELDPADGVFEDHADVVDELVLPDFLDVFLALAIVRDGVKHSVKDETLGRDVHVGNQREKDERRELGDDVVAEHFLVLRLGHCHPLALKGEITDVVTGEEDCEVLPENKLRGHWKPPV